jgi:hypothetical protein
MRTGSGACSAWLAFRDAELKAHHPNRAEPLAYGTVQPMCECASLMSRVVAST